VQTDGYSKNRVRALRTSTALLILFLVASLLLLKANVSYSQTETINNAQNQIHAAYQALIEANDAGGDTSELADKLNQALNLTSQAEQIINTDPSNAERLATEAQTLANNVATEAPAIKEEGIRQEQLTTALVAASIATLITVGIVIYISGPKALWKMWLRLRRNYRVRVRNSSTHSKGLIITSEEICALILGVTIIIAFFAASQVFFGQRVAEPFSELGILGPAMKLGDYPTEVVAGENITLYAYVGNQMGRPIYYIVMVKLGDNTTSVNPATIQPNQQFEKIISNNETWTFPVTTKLTKTGLNQRIIFELWNYNETLNQNQYDQRWGQVWLNVTAPAT
jgi:uncharacterized membrane protein